GALEAFTKAKEFGLKCFYDLPTGHWRAARRLLEAERTLWPEWEMTLGYFQDSETKLARKDKELNLADMIITASTFTASTLKEFPGELPPVKVIPYGFPVVMEGPKSAVQISTSRPLRLLFVGALSQGKGIANVFAAVKPLGNKVELTVVGLKGGR